MRDMEEPTYLGLLVVTALTRGAPVDHAWEIAEEVAAETPADLRAAMREVAAQTDRHLWPNGVS